MFARKLQTRISLDKIYCFFIAFWPPVPKVRYSLVYNTSVRHEWHKRHECNMSPTRVRHEQREYYTNNTSATRVRHEWKHFCTPIYLLYGKWKIIREEQFQSKNYLLEIPWSHAKVRLKSVPEEPNFVMVKAVSKVIHWRL